MSDLSTRGIARQRRRMTADLGEVLDEVAAAFPVGDVSPGPWVVDRGAIAWMVREGPGGPQIGNFIYEADARFVADCRNRALAEARVGSPQEPPADGEPDPWEAAEEAMPPGWRLQGLQLVDTSDSEDLREEHLEWEAEASSEFGQRSVNALGPTPGDALRRLASRMAGVRR